MTMPRSGLRLEARPEPLAISAEHTAIVVNDMQNAFCLPGGFMDRLGFDIGGAAEVIEVTARVFSAARRAGIAIFHGQFGLAPDLSDVPPYSPWWYKSVQHMGKRTDQSLIEGTWDFELVDELAPLPGEVVFRKSRTSCFDGSTLESHLRARNINTILVVGISSNVGVEWTLRDAVEREFYGVLIKDATMPAGPEEVQRTVVHNVENFIGWTTTSHEFDALCTRLGPPAQP